MIVDPDVISEWTGNEGMTEMMRELAWVRYTPLHGEGFGEIRPDGNLFAAGVCSPTDIAAIDDPDRTGPSFVLGGSSGASSLPVGAGGFLVDMDSVL